MSETLEPQMEMPTKMPGHIARISQMVERSGRDLLRLEVKGCILEITALPPIRGIRNTHSKVFTSFITRPRWHVDPKCSRCSRFRHFVLQYLLAVFHSVSNSRSVYQECLLS